MRTADTSALGSSNAVETFASASATEVFVGTADESREVAAAIADVVAMGLRLQHSFGLLQDGHWVAAQRVDEGACCARKAVQFVNVGEQESGTAVGGASVVARLLGDGGEVVGRQATASVVRGAGGASAMLVGAQQSGDQHGGDGCGEGGTAQRGQLIGNARGEREQRPRDVFERAKCALDGGLAGGLALALRSMLGFEIVQSFARGLRHVRCALVGDGLGAWAISQRGGDGIDDPVGALVVADDDRVEQARIAAADVLCGDELEGHAEGAQVGGVGADLGAGQRHVEVEPTATRWSRTRRLGLGRRAW